MRNRILLVAAILGLLATSCKKENENPQNDLTVTPITISTNYGENNGAKVSYTESGDVISATWDAGDQLYVVYNGHVNTLTLTDGAGTASATFTGSIIGTPTAMSVLICYVRDANNTSAVTVSPTGEYTYTSGTFLNQDGTLEGAAKCNLYYGTTTYGTGSDISCTFSPNTSMLKFSVAAPDGVTAGTEGATLTYKSGETELAKATFIVGAGGRNTVYMTIPAGSYSGSQTLVYTSGETEQTETLSSTQANFTAGQTYSKIVTYASFTDLSQIASDYEAQNNEVLTGSLNGNYKITIADGATVTFSDMTINGANNGSYRWAGITCLGDATIILVGNNTVKGFYEDYAGIQVGPSGTTLTIQGDGSLTVRSNGCAAGVGSSRYIQCGNLVINNGVIDATGGSSSSGIGCGRGGNCGNITINGGTITAVGGNDGHGIGNSYQATCGNITITDDVTQVTVTKGIVANGTVTIGGIVYPGGITASPYTYPNP